MNSFDYYIAVDWSQANMAIALWHRGLAEPSSAVIESDVRRLRSILKSLKGTKVLTFEECTVSQWLYVELRAYVDELIVCDPYYNSLLSSGPKNDRIDALKLLELLRAGLLTPVYHSGDVFIYYRRLVSTYSDIVKSVVCWKNRRSAILRGMGKGRMAKLMSTQIDKFNLAMAERIIEELENKKMEYMRIFESLVQGSKVLRALKSIPGIGVIGAVKIAAVVVDPERFKDKGHFWSYCGLVKHQKMSGGKNYGKRKPRYNRTLKSVFKTAALAVINGGERNSMRGYYEHLINEEKLAEHNARNKVARKIAEVALAVMLTEKYFVAGRFNKCKKRAGN